MAELWSSKNTIFLYMVENGSKSCGVFRHLHPPDGPAGAIHAAVSAVSQRDAEPLAADDAQIQGIAHPEVAREVVEVRAESSPVVFVEFTAVVSG